MAADHFDKQMEWVQSLTGDQKVIAGSVVAWQAIATTLNELVKHFNSIAHGSQEEDSKRTREVQLKKVIIGMLYEMDGCLDYWAMMLREKGLLDQKIKECKKKFKRACRKIGLHVLKQVRNGVAFHFTDFLSDPDAIVEVYRMIDRMSLCSINEILREANHCGFAMRSKVVETIK